MIKISLLQDLLNLDEVDSSQHPYLCNGQKPKSNTLCLTEKAEETRLTLNKLGASWYSENNRMALSGISFHVAKVCYKYNYYKPQPNLTPTEFADGYCWASGCREGLTFQYS